MKFVSIAKVLIEGYAKEIKGGWKASSTTILIRDGDKNILVDPGTNKPVLLASLKKEGLTINDINMVFLTHYHLDHTLLAGIFEKALVLDGSTIYDQDNEIEYSDKIPGTDIQVVATPGHAYEQASLVIKTDQGRVVIASDLFWWTENEEQKTDNVEILINREDPFVKDPERLKASRKKILEMADWIIPGHGKMFKSPK